MALTAPSRRNSLLDDLYAGAIADSAARQELITSSALEKMALAQPPALDILSSFSAARFVQVIAEIKRASPSRGMISQIVDPANLAQVYETGGAAAISVLTEERRFLGSLADFDLVRETVSLPLLRKDFIANEYQILEARAHGADVVLLIVAGLDTRTLKRLKDFIEQLGMTAFLETHSAPEIQIANELESRFTGINARDLSTFETNRELFAELAELVDPTAIRIAESAVRGVDDVVAYASAGADGVLVGEALVSGNAPELLRSMTNIPKA